MNLNQLRYLTLRGNKIQGIADEAFQVCTVIQYVCILLFVLFWWVTDGTVQMHGHAIERFHSAHLQCARPRFVSPIFLAYDLCSQYTSLCLYLRYRYVSSCDLNVIAHIPHWCILSNSRWLCESLCFCIGVDNVDKQAIVNCVSAKVPLNQFDDCEFQQFVFTCSVRIVEKLFE